MAVKRVSRKSKNPINQESSIPDIVETKEAVAKERKMGWLGWVGVVFALLCLFWWKTNSWPVVAVVGIKPIFRYEVNQQMYKQYGKSVVDGMVTESLIKTELRNGGIKISKDVVEGKLAEIKKNFASDTEFENALTERNLSLSELNKQIEIQLGIEKYLDERIEVTASETAKFIKEMGSLMTATNAADKEVEARKIIRDQKLQQEISSWIEGIRAKGKVWWIGKI